MKRFLQWAQLPSPLLLRMEWLLSGQTHREVLWRRRSHVVGRVNTRSPCHGAPRLIDNTDYYQAVWCGPSQADCAKCVCDFVRRKKPQDLLATASRVSAFPSADHSNLCLTFVFSLEARRTPTSHRRALFTSEGRAFMMFKLLTIGALAVASCE